MILIIDLEATCADDGSIPAEQMEIIEIGACWTTPTGQIIDQFQAFVRPAVRQQLSAFCRSLTHIEQAAIDTASPWPVVATKLAKFIRLHHRPGSFWGSWGNYDRKQIGRECARHDIANPLAELEHRNLKAIFAKRRKIKQVGMATALQIAVLPLEGTQHRGLDDALNIARLLPHMLG